MWSAPCAPPLPRLQFRPPPAAAAVGGLSAVVRAADGLGDMSEAARSILRAIENMASPMAVCGFGSCGGGGRGQLVIRPL